ncbi:MAG: HEPN domain-containing protein [Pseudobdellovibrionaceae bacterium]
MNNPKLGNDYIHRAHGRLKAIETLLNEKLFADVVRESQEACELALKGVIRNSGHTVPHTHEVSQKLWEIKEDLPKKVVENLDLLTQISKNLRRDRELSFYGSEDITPGDFYEEHHALEAMRQLKEVLKIIPR